MKNVVYEQITESVDVQTGETFQLSSTKKYKVETEPEYIKMYIRDIARLRDVPKGMDRILLTLVRNMGYNNLIPAYMPIKKMIAHDLGISVSYLNNAIDIFHKKGILIRIARGMYIADPELFAKGKWEDIKKLRLVIEYNQNGTKKLQSNIPEEIQLKLGI